MKTTNLQDLDLEKQILNDQKDKFCIKIHNFRIVNQYFTILRTI